MDFHGVDLNLLAAFDALYTERHVTRAAARVGVSQPAMSAALARLRRLFDDALFLRSAAGLLPTARAREIAEPVSQALRQIETALVLGPKFDPAKVTQTFNLGLGDYATHIMLPAVAQAVQAAAPGATLHVKPVIARDSAIDLLDAGQIDFAIGVAPSQAHGRIHSRPLLDDEFVTLVRRGHPLVHGELDLETFLTLKHILASPEGDRHGVVDQALSQMDRRRHVALVLPQMFALPTIVAGGDLAATLLRRVVPPNSEATLTMLTPPLALPRIPFHLIWHQRNDGHPAQQWLRALVTSLAAKKMPSPG